MSVYESTPKPDARLASHLTELIERMQTSDDADEIVAFHEAVEAAGEQWRDHVAEIVRVRSELSATLAAIDSEMKRLQNLRDEREARIIRLESILSAWLEQTGIRDVLTPLGTVRLKLNPPSVVVHDETLIPAEYMRTKVTETTSPDKTAIKEAIKAGIDIPGCELTQKTKLEIK